MSETQASAEVGNSGTVYRGVIRAALCALALAACSSPEAETAPLGTGDTFAVANADVFSTIHDVEVIGFPNVAALDSCTIDSTAQLRHCTFNAAAVRVTATVTLLDATGKTQLTYSPSTTRTVHIQATLLISDINILPYASGLIGEYSAATLDYTGLAVNQGAAWSWNGTRTDSLLIDGSPGGRFFMVKFTSQLQNVVTKRTFSNAAPNDSSVFAPLSGTIRRSGTILSYLTASTDPAPYQSTLTFDGTLTPGVVVSGSPFKEDIYSGYLIKPATP